ncbi:hypothetical protein [Scandinavium manionii]|uniref:hypothetical protein n=1 Tax=Scandinavium manionii TaxID=2926520 RepID=UPI002166583F|nr:hypothetical protein [Scandinavium manionii]MCS2150755.1 hypothetical protein [Scandinavium manionii]
MPSSNPADMNNTTLSIGASASVQRLSASMQQFRAQQEESRVFSEPVEFDPSPSSALGMRAHDIRGFCDSRPSELLTEYLRGLGFVREHLIAARNTLKASGKKKYEAYIKNAVEALPARFCGLNSYYLKILTDLMAIPFRRSAEKDRRELSDSLCLIANFIEKYRYCATDDRYRLYATTIVNDIDTEQLPPMIAGIIIREVTSLVNTACVANVLTFACSGITHEEYWRYTDPDDFAEVYPGGEIPDDASPLDMLDIYQPHHGIAQQSLWYGLDNYVDDFVVSLAGGLLCGRMPEQPRRVILKRA